MSERFSPSLSLPAYALKDMRRSQIALATLPAATASGALHDQLSRHRAAFIG